MKTQLIRKCYTCTLLSVMNTQTLRPHINTNGWGVFFNPIFQEPKIDSNQMEFPGQWLDIQSDVIGYQ